MDNDLMLRVVEAIAGENGRRIVEVLLASSEGLSDEEISDKLGLRVNDVRRVLYELASQGIIAYKRSTSESSRWYTYVWFTNAEMVSQAIIRKKKEVLRVLSTWLSYEESLPPYICPYDYSLYTFDDAFENNFRCLKCGADLIEIDNNKVLSFIKKLMDTLSI